MLRCLFLDLNSFFAHVEQQLDPTLRGRPVGVAPLLSEHTSLIAASYEAKAYGLKTGTPVREARQRCPDLTLIEASHERYVRFHHAILEEVDKHTPVSAVCSIDEMACELFANDRAPRDAIALAQRIKAGMAANIGACLTCSIGVAPNQFLAKLASDMQKPDGLTLIHPHSILSQIGHLPVGELCGIGKQMEARLHKAGLRRIGQLWQLSKQELRALWGSINGERFWYHLHGYTIPPVETKRSSLGHSHVLRPELRPPEQARLVARRLASKAASRLRRMEALTRRVHLSIKLEQGYRFHLEQPVSTTQDTFTLLAALEQLWRQCLAQSGPHWRIKKIGVNYSHLVPQAALQLNLFDMPESGASNEKRQVLSSLMDKLNARFGRDAIMVGLLPKTRSRDTGTKIAFTRVPDLEEFYE